MRNEKRRSPPPKSNEKRGADRDQARRETRGAERREGRASERSAPGRSKPDRSKPDRSEPRSSEPKSSAPGRNESGRNEPGKGTERDQPAARTDHRDERRNQDRAKRWSDRAVADDGPTRIFGIHSVEAALLNPARKVLRLLLTENAEKRLEAALAKRAVEHQSVHPRDLDRLLGDDTVHQGALLESEPLAEVTVEELAERASRGGPIIVLDQVTDPHNVGAIMRSAAAFGASGLIMTRRNSPPLSGALAKSASGALEHVPVALVPNLAQAMGKLGDLAVMRIGLDGEATALVEDQDLKSGIALVLGAEGKGLRRLTRELCDQLCRITTGGALQSLNVSNAAAIALHASAVQRRRA